MSRPLDALHGRERGNADLDGVALGPLGEQLESESDGGGEYGTTRVGIGLDMSDCRPAVLVCDPRSCHGSTVPAAPDSSRR